MAVPKFILGELRETDLNLIHFEIHLLQKNTRGRLHDNSFFFILKFKEKCLLQEKVYKDLRIGLPL